MKIVFLDLYTPQSSRYKDPITLPLGLVERGHDVSLVSTAPFFSADLYGFQVTPLSEWLSMGMRAARPDLVVAISRFDPSLTPALRMIKEAGLPLAVKGDTDGTLGYPLVPNYLRTRAIAGHPMNIFRHLKWRLPIRTFVYPKLEHVALADVTVTESPGAASNVCHVLSYWGRSEMTHKVRFIPNSVSTEVTRRSINASKEKLIVSVGRWEDALCKGSDLLAQTIVETLGARTDYQFVVVGSGAEFVSRRLPAEIREKVLFTGPLGFEAAHDIIASARILLVPSRLESFSLVTAEALCAGSSVVVTPIESLIYLAGGGAYGSIAESFSAPAIAAALMNEIRCWDEGCRDPLAAAKHWRASLNEAAISQAWEGLLSGMHLKAGHARG